MKRKRGSSTRSRRVIRDNANRMLPTPVRSVQLDLEDFLRKPTEIEDRRQYHPDDDWRSPRDVRGNSDHVLVVTGHDRKRVVSPFVGFEVPQQVMVCVRRKQRREVLHALNKTGRGGQRRPRRGPYSDVRC